VVGYVSGSHGVRGMLRVHLHDPRSGALAPGRRVALRRDGRTLATHEVRQLDPVPGKPGHLRVALAGVPGRDEADALRGCELLVARRDLPALADDEFYLADAIGLSVVRQSDQRALGTIVGLTSNGVQDLFEVEHHRRRRQHRHRVAVTGAADTFIEDIGDRPPCSSSLPIGLLPAALELEPDAAP
jgi:16S rRNA processing protein RimM